MNRQLTITTAPIDEAALVAGRAASGGMGAAVYFTGLVRNSEDGKVIQAIEYEAFQKMVERQVGLLFDDLEKRWPVESVRLAHRVGVVKVSEPSLWVEVITPHSGEAFAACQWHIDEMKRVVPNWKKAVACWRRCYWRRCYWRLVTTSRVEPAARRIRSPIHSRRTHCPITAARWPGARTTR
jgi:molybdopterin synthase catalytic subunit